MRDTFDKVVMDETRREDIRAGLMKKRKAKKTWLAPVAAIAAAIAIIMIVPGTREFVVKAAETLYGSFKSSFNNLNIEIEETSYSESDGVQVYRITTYYDFLNAEPWAQVKDGRLFFVLNGKSTDITDKCSEEEYYCFEQKSENGYKTSLFVGGTPEDYGWGQLVWNPQGELIECMVVLKEENADPAWVKNLIKKESVDEYIITKFSIDDYSALDMKAKTDTVVDYTGIVEPEN